MVVTRYKGQKIIGKKVSDVFRVINELIEIERKETLINASCGEMSQDGQIRGNKVADNE